MAVEEEEEEVQEPTSPQKRKRRPSVRLGEIGYPASYLAAASYLLESAKRKKQHKQQQSQPQPQPQLLVSGSSPVKAPRTRLLDHVPVEKKKKQQQQQQVDDQRWRSFEAAGAADNRQQQSAGEEEEAKTEAAAAAVFAASSGREVKQVRRKRAGLGARFVVVADHSDGKLEQQQQQQHEREEERFEDDQGADDADDDDDGNAPAPSPRAWHVDEHETSFPKTSSSSLELFGDGGGKLEVAADSRDPATAATSAEEEEGEEQEQEQEIEAEEAEEEGDDANPNSLGDEIQGAIEDGPMRRRVGKPDMEQGVGRQRVGDSSDMAGENGANLSLAKTKSTRQCSMTLASGVRGWLCARDLGRYSEMFELNEVDNEVLPLLTMEDLREMGVTAVGARRKMFNAIQELRGSYGT